MGSETSPAHNEEMKLSACGATVPSPGEVKTELWRCAWKGRSLSPVR
jgi:hypothetical protein